MQNKGSLQHRFDSFGADASPAVWNGIASKLDQNKRKKGLIIWWTTTGIAACLLTIFGLQFMGGNTTQNQAINELPQAKSQETVVTPVKNNANTSQKTNQTEITQNENSTVTKNEIINTHSQQTKKDLKHNENTIANQQNVTKNINNTLEQTTTKNESLAITENIEIEKLKRELNADLTLNQSNCELVIQNIDYTPKQTLKWEIGVKFQSHFGLTDPVPNSGGAINSISQFDASSNSLLPPPFPELKTTRPLTIRFELKRKVKKRIGFKTGVDVGWIFTQTVESVYSYRKSIITVGVPIKLDLKILSKKRFALHSDFGLVNDIPILEFGNNELANESTAKKVKLVSGFMGGIEMGLNANYNLNENFKISAGTGIKWYYLQRIKNTSPVIQQNIFGVFNLGLIWGLN